MRRIALFAFLLIPAQLHAADFDPKPLDAVVETAMKEMEIPGAAVVVVQDDRIVYLKGFGVREKGKPEKVTPETVFAIASCSKAFTSTLIAMLVDEGKVKWDDKVRDHLDYFHLSDELADREVTLRDLLSHRTGMPRHDMIWAGQSIDSNEVIHRWMKGQPSTSFRSHWEYSNVPFTTAGVIAGRFEKGEWADAVQKKIFDPLHMTSSSGSWRKAVASPDHATPHYHHVDKSLTTVKWDEIEQAGGAGCVNSNVRDMGQWLRFQLGGGSIDGKRLVAEKVLKETRMPQMLFRPEGSFAQYFPPKASRFTSYGLGWFVHDYRGYDCVSHGGTLTGFRAQCMMIPDKKIGVFVSCNLRPSLFCETVAKTALDQMLGLPAEDWVKASQASLALLDSQVIEKQKKREAERKPDTKPSLPLKSFTGSYDEPAYGKAEVILDGDKLWVKWGKVKFRLDHYHFDTYTAVPVEPKDELVSHDRSIVDVQFRLGINGEAEGMKFLDQEFKKVKK